jgi:hypothetical protein
MEFSDDPTADFLAREQAILGDEAALFGNALVSQTPAAAPSQLPTGSTPTQNIAAEFEEALFVSAPPPATFSFVI